MLTTEFDWTKEIASWDAQPTDEGHPGSGDSTELDPQAVEDPRWGESFDALLGVLNDPTRGEEGVDFPPSRAAIIAALTWMQVLRSLFPSAPPSVVLPDPAGGIILERHVVTADGEEIIQEFSFPNVGDAEYTHYFQGEVVSMEAIPVPRESQTEAA